MKKNNIKTVRDLKNMLNVIKDDAVLDKEIYYCFEDDGFGTKCAGAWFDLEEWYVGGVEEVCFPTIAMCKSEKDVLEHEGKSPWTELSNWIKAEL